MVRRHLCKYLGFRYKPPASQAKVDFDRQNKANKVVNTMELIHNTIRVLNTCTYLISTLTHCTSEVLQLIFNRLPALCCAIKLPLYLTSLSIIKYIRADYARSLQPYLQSMLPYRSSTRLARICYIPVPLTTMLLMR